MPDNNFKQNNPTPFNLTKSPLKGFNLIDASAGTGKTFTICSLVIRLLLEKNLNIDQILVVTYTEAATEDLRDRIRQKLRLAAEATATGESEDAFLKEYLPHIDQPAKAAKVFSDALRGFDEAAVYTIHSFCQRMLLEYSFESNSLFDTELVADDSFLVQEIIEDFWRRNFYRSSDLFAEYLSVKLTPGKLLEFLSVFIPRPLLKFIPELESEIECTEVSNFEAEYIEAYRAVCRVWSATRDKVEKHWLASGELNRNIYRDKQIPGLLAAMDNMAAACSPSFNLFDKFSHFTGSKIISATTKNKTPRILPFYELCENLTDIHAGLADRYDRCILARKKELADSFRHEFEVRKKEAAIYSFDDLLRRLHEALSGSYGPIFSRAVAQKYPAVMIDEFQDTDPMQFEIFKKIHNGESLLFLIGDPKQAIYSFRGADIFTYMDAAGSKPLSHYTLGVNHRSIPELVKAVNTLFSSSGNPFIFEAISFQPVSSAERRQDDSLTIDGRQEEPFILWHFGTEISGRENSDAAEKPAARLTRTVSRQLIIKAVSSEVFRILGLAAENRVFLNGRKLLPGDIAILVRTNNEAREMQQVLGRSRIPSVLHSGEDLFSADEAREMALLLGALAEPHNIRKLKTALLTRLLGVSRNDIALDNPDADEVIGHWLAQFRAYHGIWNRYGFIRMFWNIMAGNRIRSRMLSLENGERILTNFLHLAEILHQEEEDRGLNMTGLLGFLHERLAGEPVKIMEHQLRLESDADRVKIVTIHKAKGLEYPVVFCPFTWEGSRLHGSEGCIFHGRSGSENGTELFYDGGSPELASHLKAAAREEMAENLRLLYVAVTRASHRCYLAWGPIKGADSSAPAYLLHQGNAGFIDADISKNGQVSGDLLIRKTAERFLGLSGSEFLADLHELAAASENTIRVSPPPLLASVSSLKEAGEPIRLNPRIFKGVIDTSWNISSFSSLMMHRSPSREYQAVSPEDTPGLDDFSILPVEEELGDRPGKTGYDVFSLPRGPRAGTMLHQLLEYIDFSRFAEQSAVKLIRDKLLSFGYDPAWQPVITGMLADISGIALHDKVPGLRLADIPPENCLRELEFYFPLQRLTPKNLKAVFSGRMHGESGSGISFPEQQLDRLIFSPARGFMKGFIDLVFEFQGRFYLLDWKSNYLGPHIENYRSDRLLHLIHTEFYFLQYHLYSLALHLYLQSRLPGYRYETSFGGIFYIFLRGVRKKLGPDYGVFFDRPGFSTMEHFTETLVAENDPMLSQVHIHD